MAYDFNIKKVTTKKIFVTMRKSWKLLEDSIRRAFSFYVRQFNESSVIDVLQTSIQNPIKHLA